MSTTQSGENTNGGSAEGATQESRPELAQYAEIERLRAENQALKTENWTLKTENWTLKSDKKDMQSELDCWIGTVEDPQIENALEGNLYDTYPEWKEEWIDEMIQRQKGRNARDAELDARLSGGMAARRNLMKDIERLAN